MSLAITAGLGLGGNESYPDLFQPYGGFPDGVAVSDGYVELPAMPGIGFEGKADLIKEMRSLADAATNTCEAARRRTECSPRGLRVYANLKTNAGVDQSV